MKVVNSLTVAVSMIGVSGIFSILISFASGTTYDLFNGSGTKFQNLTIFQTLQYNVPRVEIIWGDEDNDQKVYLKYIETNNQTVSNSDFYLPRSDEHMRYPVISKCSRFQASEIWNASTGAPGRTETITTATLSPILQESNSSVPIVGDPIILERSQVFPKTNFDLCVDPNKYILTINKELSKSQLKAVYETRLVVVH